jgi:AraC-like DNA-binding protein
MRRLQCRLAKELISKGYSSKAAAAELKFATLPHFCREFKKVFGVSPQKLAPKRSAYAKLYSLAKKLTPSSPAFGNGSSTEKKTAEVILQSAKDQFSALGNGKLPFEDAKARKATNDL